MIKIGKDCNLNIQKLIATRMLVNANSGGGKSYALRKFLEESSGTFNTYISELRRNGLIEINGEIKISDEFFN